METLVIVAISFFSLLIILIIISYSRNNEAENTRLTVNNVQNHNLRRRVIIRAPVPTDAETVSVEEEV